MPLANQEETLKGKRGGKCIGRSGKSLDMGGVPNRKSSRRRRENSQGRRETDSSTRFLGVKVPSSHNYRRGSQTSKDRKSPGDEGGLEGGAIGKSSYKSKLGEQGNTLLNAEIAGGGLTRVQRKRWGGKRTVSKGKEA